MSHDLMNINLEAYRYSARMHQAEVSVKLISRIYIHNFYIGENQESLPLNYVLLVKIRPALPKPGQVQHEINIETASHVLPNLYRLCVI